jgi:hypothetical protein
MNIKRVRIQHNHSLIYIDVNLDDNSLVRVKLGGDLMDVTSKLSALDRAILTKKVIRKLRKEHYLSN